MHQNISLGSNGVDRNAFVMKNSNATSWQELLHLFGLFCTEFLRQPNGPECTQIVRTHQNVSLGSSRVDRVHSLRIIWTRPRGMNFCTSSARFAPSIVRQPNGPECTQIVRNAPERHLGSNGVDRVCSLQQISTQVVGTNFCTSSACFAPSFVRQPNGPECTQIVRNALKHQFNVQ